MTETVRQERPAADVRTRLHGSALRLFSEHGVSGTSLQMIADDLGVTKAAVYYHYRTKDELLLGVISPFIDQLVVVVEGARSQRGRRAQTDAALTGLVDVVVAARRFYVVMSNDPTITTLRGHHAALNEVGTELLDLFTGPDADAEARITALVFLAGLTGPLNDPACGRMPDDELRELLLRIGRRALAPRRRASR